MNPAVAAVIGVMAGVGIHDAMSLPVAAVMSVAAGCIIIAIRSCGWQKSVFRAPCRRRVGKSPTSRKWRQVSRWTDQ